MRDVRLHRQPLHGLSVKASADAGDTVAVQHLLRYYWASSLCMQPQDGVAKRVLFDLGCGDGYGCEIVARACRDAAMVVGVDADPVAVNDATAKYVNSHGGVPRRFCVADLDKDWVTVLRGRNLVMRRPVFMCFDVLDMLNSREVFLMQLRSLLMTYPDSALLLSIQPTESHNTDHDYSPSWSARRIRYHLPTLTRMLRLFFPVMLTGEELRDSEGVIQGARERYGVDISPTTFYCRVNK